MFPCFQIYCSTSGRRFKLASLIHLMLKVITKRTLYWSEQRQWPSSSCMCVRQRQTKPSATFQERKHWFNTTQPLWLSLVLNQLSLHPDKYKLWKPTVSPGNTTVSTHSWTDLKPRPQRLSGQRLIQHMFYCESDTTIMMGNASFGSLLGH